MDKNMAIVAIAIVLLALAVFQTFQLAGTANAIGVGYAAAQTQGPYDGFATYEEMMEAHHGSLSGAGMGADMAGNALPQQVGGC